MSVTSLAGGGGGSGMGCSLSKLAACDGVPACELCSLAWFDEGDAETEVSVGDTLVIRPASSILVEFTGETGSNAVRMGRRSGRLVVSESGDGPHGGYDGAYAR